MINKRNKVVFCTAFHSLVDIFLQVYLSLCNDFNLIKLIFMHPLYVFSAKNAKPFASGNEMPA